MKITTTLYLLLLIFLFSGCEEICDCPEEPKKTTCNFTYDSDIYIPTNKVTQLITPTLSDTTGGGTFTVEPQGLDIDSKTGTININTSESGVQYYIKYTSPDGNNTCETSITISGIDYPSDTFKLTIEDRFIVEPFLDADRDQTAPPGIYDQPGQLGRPDVVPASEFGLAIDTNTGTIDLRQTIENIRASGVEVENGFNREFEIVYALEGKQDLVSSIKIIVFFFETVDDIPQELLNILAEKQRFPRNGKELGKQPPYLIGVAE